MINLTLIRKYKKENYTVGCLYINGEYFSNTLEDTDRNLYVGMQTEWISQKKVYGKTAIPYGRYEVTLKVKSRKYSKKKQYEFCEGFLPRLLNVPGFEGILIHIGNFPEDTEGCILVGENKVKGGVVNSTKYFKQLYEILKEADNNNEEIWLTIDKD